MKALEFAKDLIRFDTTSSVSNTAATDYIETVLQQNGFQTERIEYTDGNGIAKSNVIGRKGPGTAGVAWFGHTDVVPADTWFSKEFGPFTPFVQDGRLFGRGSCDMKGGIACMLAAVEPFAASELQHPVYIACTADEEVGYFGAEQVARRSELFREIVAGQSRGLIGEPTELEVVYAHKGGYGIRATARGRAAHSSTRDGINANLAMIPFLAEMKRLYDETESDPKWQDASFDPPTVCWNIGINDFTRAMNITAPQSVCTVYFRPMPGQDTDELVQRAREAADACGLEFEVRLEAPPLYIDPESPFVRDMIALCGRPNPRTVPYGTDGAMFTELENLVVLGPGSIAQAHTADEWIQLEQLERGTDLYTQCIRRWCC